MSIDSTPDPYVALKLSKGASLDAIKSSYRKLVLQCHPDKNQDKDEVTKAKKAEEFHLIQQAYETLTDPVKRQEYEDTVRLAELRKETPRSRSDRFGGVDVRTAAPPPRMYTERSAPPRFDDDSPPSPFYDKKYDAYDAGPPRRASTKGDDYRRSQREDIRERVRVEKERMKESVKASYSRNARTRDRERRMGQEEKFRYTAYADDDDSDSDSPPRPRGFSDYEETIRKRNEEARRKGGYSDEMPRTRREAPRRRSDDEDDYPSERVRKFERQASNAKDYIERSRTGSTAHRSYDDSRRGLGIDIEGRSPSLNRSYTAGYYEVRYTSADDGVRRSSARPRERTRESRESTPISSGKERKGSIGIVDPPRERDYESSRRIPKIPHANSSPAAIKIPSNIRESPRPARSSTEKIIREVRPDMPSTLRSSTTPEATSRRKDSTTASHASKLKTSNIPTPAPDSGYSSGGTPDTPYMNGIPRSDQAPRPSTSRTPYYESPEESEGEDWPSRNATSSGRAPRPYVVEAEDIYAHRRGTRSPSPRSSRRTPDRDSRPSLGRGNSSSGAARYATPQRTTTYAYPAESVSPRQPPPRTESVRVARGQLYGEVKYSPSYGREDVRYTSATYGPRRGSDGGVYMRDSRDDPYSRHDRPPMIRRAETSVLS